MQTFDLEQLRTLAAVIDAGSLTAAAPRVFL
jgi:DNA-binding transcriptional LysR family regulator